MATLQQLAARVVERQRKEKMMVDEFGDSKVTVKKVGLLDAIRKNRDTHNADYVEAEAGYRAETIAKLKSMLTAAQDGEAIKTATGLSAPKEHLKDYDRVIRMLEMSTADDIVISEAQFKQYVMDEWSWADDFASSKARYSNNAR